MSNRSAMMLPFVITPDQLSAPPQRTPDDPRAGAITDLSHVGPPDGAAGRGFARSDPFTGRSLRSGRIDGSPGNTVTRWRIHRCRVHRHFPGTRCDPPTFRLLYLKYRGGPAEVHPAVVTDESGG